METETSLSYLLFFVEDRMHICIQPGITYAAFYKNPVSVFKRVLDQEPIDEIVARELFGFLIRNPYIRPVRCQGKCYFLWKDEPWQGESWEVVSNLQSEHYCELPEFLCPQFSPQGEQLSLPV